MQLILVYSHLVIQLHKSVLWYYTVDTGQLLSRCSLFSRVTFIHLSLIWLLVILCFTYIFDVFHIVLFKSSHNIILYRNIEMFYIFSHTTFF